jgi:hypothetical protein
MPPPAESGNASEQPALGARLPPQKGVVGGHRPAPRGGGGSNRAKILKQIPEAGHGVAAGCCCQLLTSRRRGGGQLSGPHQPPAAIHGGHGRQADRLPHASVDAGGRLGQPEVLGGEVPAAQLGRQAGDDSNSWVRSS